LRGAQQQPARGAQVVAEDTRGARQPPAEGSALDEDVAEEEKRMRAMLAHRTGVEGELAGAVEQRNAIEVYGLRKMFGCVAAALAATAGLALKLGMLADPAPGAATLPQRRSWW
jgi:hypothetical protein